MSYSISHSILQTFLLLISITFTSFVTLEKEVKVLSPSYFFLHLSDRHFISQPFIHMILSLMYLTVVTMLIPSHFNQIQTGFPHGCKIFWYNNLFHVQHIFHYTYTFGLFPLCLFTVHLKTLLVKFIIVWHLLSLRTRFYPRAA
jgi:hypothetical protein